MVLNTNITHLIGMARMGICLPKGCKQHHYDAFTTSSNNMVNGFLDKLADYYHHPQFHGGFVREWTRVGMTLTKSDEYTESWLERTSSGVIPVAILIGMFIVFMVTINIVKYIRYKQSEMKLKKQALLPEIN